MPAIDYSAHLASTLTPAPAAAGGAAGNATTADAASKPAFSFADFLDIINPLQHFPVISTLYRHLTGDTIGVPEKIAGDTLYGGFVGLIASLGDTLFQDLTGKDIGDTVYAFLTGSGDKPSTAVAAAPTATPASVTPASAISLNTPDMTSLLSVIERQGIDADTTQRALSAYARAGAAN
ncbi:MAG: hypothetical protein KGJ78_04595 [Alphaproteobacteria bacterium]|nr:hypothetical protein [Alphaproteobacteria bacterium]